MSCAPGDVRRVHGFVADTFQDGSDVAVSGQLGPHGVTVAPNGVMATCPSKDKPKPTL